MDIQDSDYLKNWREKLGVSQKRFAELADISLTTLRQFESGSHKPQRKTLKKLTEVMQGIEAGSFSESAIRPPRKKRLGANASEAPDEAGDAFAKRRGRPPRLHQSDEYLSTPAIEPQTQNAEVVAPAPVQLPTSFPAIQNSSGVIQLSNLDLELINRVLNMSGKEKLALLTQLM